MCGARSNLVPVAQRPTRYRCHYGCNWDMCGACYDARAEARGTGRANGTTWRPRSPAGEEARPLAWCPARSTPPLPPAHAAARALQDPSRIPGAVIAALEDSDVEAVLRWVDEGGNVNAMRDIEVGVDDLRGLPIDFQSKAYVMAMGGENKATGCTLLLWAVSVGNERLVEGLLKRNADVDRTDSHGCTPMMMAATNGFCGIVELLARHGAHPGKMNHNGWNGLTIACLAGRERMVDTLVKWGASVNEPDEDGMTPLMHAAQSNRSAVVQLLLQSGANVELVNKQGQTALQLARAEGNTRCVRPLERKASAEKRRSSSEASAARRRLEDKDTKTKGVKALSGYRLQCTQAANALRQANAIGKSKYSPAKGFGWGGLARDKDETTPRHLRGRFGDLKIGAELTDGSASSNGSASSIDGEKPPSPGTLPDAVAAALAEGDASSVLDWLDSDDSAGDTPSMPYSRHVYDTFHDT